MSTPEVTTDVPAEVVFTLCCEYLESLKKAKEETKRNFFLHYMSITKFSWLKMQRVHVYTREEAIQCADSTTDWQFIWNKRNEVLKIKNLAFRDLSATMQVNYKAWNMIHKRFTAATPENRHNEDF